MIRCSRSNYNARAGPSPRGLVGKWFCARASPLGRGQQSTDGRARKISGCARSWRDPPLPSGVVAPTSSATSWWCARHRQPHPLSVGDCEILTQFQKCPGDALLERAGHEIQAAQLHQLSSGRTYMREVPGRTRNLTSQAPSKKHHDKNDEDDPTDPDSARGPVSIIAAPTAEHQK